jgi:hypothetical protein
MYAIDLFTVVNFLLQMLYFVLRNYSNSILIDVVSAIHIMIWNDEIFLDFFPL